MHMTEECHQLPNLLVRQNASPTGHGGPADAMLKNVKILVIRHVGHIIHELRRRRIERIGEQ